MIIKALPRPEGQCLNSGMCLNGLAPNLPENGQFGWDSP